MTAPYQRIHVIINPASGKNQPMLNIINDVCKKYGVEWDATVTHKYGDAAAQARAAIAAGVDLVAGYGVLAYPMTVRQQVKEMVEAEYRLTIDGEVIERRGTRCYVVNSGMTGRGITAGAEFSATDGLLDVFLLKRDLAHVEAVAERFLHVDRPMSGLDYWRGKEITVESDPDRPVWTDGEYSGRTPVTATVLPGALAVVVP